MVTQTWLRENLRQVLIVAAAVATGFAAGNWYNLSRYEVIKMRIQDSELIYRIDHKTGETWFLNPARHRWQRIQGLPMSREETQVRKLLHSIINKLTLPMSPEETQVRKTERRKAEARAAQERKRKAALRNQDP